METQAEIENQQRQTFNMTITELNAMIAKNVNPALAWGFRTNIDFSFSILSDAQELISFGDKASLEQARQMINQAKYIMTYGGK